MTAEKNRKTRLLFLTPKQEVPRAMYTRKVRERYTRSAQVLPNLPTAYLAAYLEQAGIQVDILDAFALGLSVEETAARVRRLNPDLLGYNLITENFLDTLAWIGEIKQRTGIRTVVGGLQLALYPEETLSYREIDIGVTGEGWRTLEELIHCLDRGGDLAEVRGICYREGGTYRNTPDRSEDLSLEDVPYPARHLLPNECYTTVMSKEWPITVMISASGCPFHCAYCDVPHEHYFSRSAAHVVGEMEECVKRYGIREIWFQDESFTVSRDRVLEICDGILSRGLRVNWSIRTRPDLVDRELLRVMQRAGMSKVHFGVESGDPAVLKRLKRMIPIEKTREAVRISREEGLTTLGFFMIGLPGEDEKSIGKTMRLALDLDCDYIQVNKFVPCPPSPLYRELVEETGIDYWREYTLGNSGIIDRLPGLGSNLGPAELDLWQRRFFRAYYYRPSYVWKRLMKLSSIKEFRNLVGSALALR